jgi:hypothetical protein
MPLTAGQGQQQLAKHGCPELCLSGRGLDTLQGPGFEGLSSNLEVLWVDHNGLTCLAGLEACGRLKWLFAHSNALVTLKPCLPRFLRVLDVSHTRLQHLHKVLAALQKLPYLEQLNLQANPCCEEPHYRLRILGALPGLVVLDHHQVTSHERLQAARLASSNDSAGGVTTSLLRPLTVAFGSHLPAELRATAQQQGGTQATSSSRRQQRLSGLELELVQVGVSCLGGPPAGRRRGRQCLLQPSLLTPPSSASALPTAAAGGGRHSAAPGSGSSSSRGGIVCCQPRCRLLGPPHLPAAQPTAAPAEQAGTAGGGSNGEHRRQPDSDAHALLGCLPGTFSHRQLRRQRPTQCAC